MACGQKGAPLAPIVYLPRPVTDLKAKRVEGDIVLEFKVPAVNTDGSGPADLDRLEVYAHTGPLPAPADYLKYGTLVQAIEVKQPAVSAPEGQRAEGRGQTEVGATTGPAAPKQDAEAAAKAGAENALIEQGATTIVREAVTEKHMETGPMPPVRAPLPEVKTAQIETLETPETVNFALPPVRYYTIVGVSKSRNRRGPYAGPILVPLVPPLVAPEKPEATYTADAIALSWPGQAEDVAPEQEAAAAARADVPSATDSNQETAGTYEIYAAVETPGTVDAPLAGSAPTAKPQPRPTPRFGYNVYEASASAPAGASASAPSATADKTAGTPIAPLNAALLTTPAFADPRVEFGIERCYVVRRVEMAGTVAIESAPSALTCMKPVDTFAPAPPKLLQSVASGTTVNLIWEANAEADLAGYVVLRGEAPGEKLTPLTPAPITNASYADDSVRRPRSYVYEVIAVDTAGNQSGPSNRVEDTIR